MKIDSKILVDYVKKASLNMTIQTINLDFSEEGVKTYVSDATGTAMTKALLKKEAFEDYEVLGNLYIKNAKFLYDILRTFKERIEIKKVDEYVVQFSTENREVNILLADKEIISNIVDRELKIDTSITIEMGKFDIDKIIQDMKLLSINVVYISKEGNNLVFQVGKENEYDFTKNKILCEEEGEVKVGVNNAIIDFAETLSGKFTLKLGTATPLIFEEKTPFIDLTVFMAPVVELEED